MAYPCAPTIPALPGQQPAIQSQPIVVPPPVELTPRFFVGPEDPTQEALPPPSAVVSPRQITDFSLSSPHVLFWLATLARASYAPNSTPMLAAVRAVLQPNTVVDFHPNGNNLTPGYTVIKLVNGAIVVVSGTTNLNQWLEQTLNSTLTEWIGTGAHAGPYKMGTIAAYASAANAILATVDPLVPNDEPILWVGHSMGGAVAQCLHATCNGLAGKRVRSRCVTFAAPKPGDGRLARACYTNGGIFRAFITTGDFVPSLPPDLGIFRVAIPAALDEAATNWGNFRRPGIIVQVNTDGTLEGAVEPFLPLLVGQALLAAAAGHPLQTVEAHAIGTYVGRFFARVLAGTETAPSNWTDPTQLISVNANLTRADL